MSDDLVARLASAPEFQRGNLTMSEQQIEALQKEIRRLAAENPAQQFVLTCFFQRLGQAIPGSKITILQAFDEGSRKCPALTLAAECRTPNSNQRGVCKSGPCLSINFSPASRHAARAGRAGLAYRAGCWREAAR
jgi:hypothetical protein